MIQCKKFVGIEIEGELNKISHKVIVVFFFNVWQYDESYTLFIIGACVWNEK